MPRPRHIPRGFFVDLGVFETPLGGGRRVRAYAPHGHVHSRPRPVLWLFDGQNVFEDQGSFAGGWHAHEALDRFATLKRPVAPVIVSIDHGHERRIDELTPWRDGAKGGRAEDFLVWMVEQLMPVVRSSVGLRDEPAANIVGGSSLGGLAAFYAHFRFPHAFGGAMSMSPSFWFARRKIFEFVSRTTEPHTSRVYLDCGAREGRGMMIKVASEMAEHLRGRGWHPERLLWRPDARGTHSERHWRRRLPKALRFLFR
jgi:predicted alpha/beta superfamily hydrolase